jgi:hypothetical protein
MDRDDVLLRSAPPSNFFRQTATEGHNHHCGCQPPLNPASPSRHFHPNTSRRFFVNTDIAQALLSINGAASHIPRRGM